MMPPIPAWEHIHPLIVHMPLGVLLVAPLLIIAAGVSNKSRMALGIAAMIVIGFGTLGTILATASGEAASDAVSIPAGAVKVLEEHEELAEMARNVFLMLAVVYATLLGVTALWKDKVKRALWIGGHVVYLALLSGGLMLLANVGHEGGRLVHQYGVRAHIVGAIGPSSGDGPGKPAEQDKD